MKKMHIYIFLWVAISVAMCSKSSNLSPTVALLSAGPWKLQSSDTTQYDSAYHIIGQSTAIVNCTNRLNYVFYTDGSRSMQIYLGCGQPASQPTPTWSWYIGGKNSNILDLSAAVMGPRSGPTAQMSDSIITLTKDSLVLYQSVSPGDPYSGVSTRYPLLIKSWFTH